MLKISLPHLFPLSAKQLCASAEAAYGQKQYVKASRLWLKASALKSAEANYRLGWLHAHGRPGGDHLG